jgi:iron complex outermembrane receptor protein
MPHFSVSYKQLSAHLLITGCLAPLLLTTTIATQAQEIKRSTCSILMEEVIVTAPKREEPIKDDPLSISALSGDQLNTLKIHDLTNLGVTMPNVALDNIGTSRGIANFSIRALGVNSSIHSIDPTVGIFIDGAYLSLNTGIKNDEV